MKKKKVKEVVSEITERKELVKFAREGQYVTKMFYVVIPGCSMYVTAIVENNDKGWGNQHHSITINLRLSDYSGYQFETFIDDDKWNGVDNVTNDDILECVLKELTNVVASKDAIGDVGVRDIYKQRAKELYGAFRPTMQDVDREMYINHFIKAISEHLDETKKEESHEVQ